MNNPWRPQPRKTAIPIIPPPLDSRDNNCQLSFFVAQRLHTTCVRSSYPYHSNALYISNAKKIKS